MELVKTTDEYYKSLQIAAKFVLDNLGSAEIAIVLGSGLNSFVDELNDRKEYAYVDIPHMPQPTVKGHSGKLVYGTIEGRPVYCLAGRSHSYEGRFMFELAFMARMLAIAGVKLLIATNASGGAGSGMYPGCLMIIKDHLNFYRRNPLADSIDHSGISHDRNPIFDSIYSERMIEQARETAKRVSVKLFEGVYGSTPGPTYETPEEVKAYFKLGATAFGMSTIPETMAAKAIGMEVFAMSLITNLAAGLADEVLTHSAVTEVANESGPNFVRFIKNFVSDLSVREVKLPDPTASEGTNSPLPKPQISASSLVQLQESVKKMVSVLGSDSFQSAILLAKGQDSVVETFKPKSSISLVDIPHYPSQQPNSKGKVYNGEEKNGNRVLVITGSSLEGFLCEDAVFLVELLFLLGVKRVVQSFKVKPQKGFENLLKEEVVELSDAMDVTTIHPYSHSLSGGKVDQYSVNLRTFSTNSKGYTYINALGPSFPTPAEVESTVGCGAEFIGITTLNPIYAAQFAGLETFGVAQVFESFGAFESGSPSPKLPQLLLNCLSATTNQSKTTLQFSPEPFLEKQVTNFLPYPVIQGIYSDYEEAAKSVESHLTLSPTFTAILVDRPFESLVREQLEVEKELKFSGVKNHPLVGSFVWGKLKGSSKFALFVFGTSYFNEGKPSHEVTFNIRVRFLPFSLKISKELTEISKLLGHLKAGRIFAISPFCSVDNSIKVGQVVIAKDHVSLCGRNPLFGVNEDRWGTRFPDMGEAYTVSIRELFEKEAKDLGIETKNLIYGHVMGPVVGSFTESALVSSLGIQALCTGTAPEVVVARHMKIPIGVLGTVVASICSKEKTTDQVTSDALKKSWEDIHKILSQAISSS